MTRVLGSAVAALFAASVLTLLLASPAAADFAPGNVPEIEISQNSVDNWSIDIHVACPVGSTTVSLDLPFLSPNPYAGPNALVDGEWSQDGIALPAGVYGTTITGTATCDVEDSPASASYDVPAAGAAWDFTLTTASTIHMNEAFSMTADCTLPDGVTPTLHPIEFQAMLGAVLLASYQSSTNPVTHGFAPSVSTPALMSSVTGTPIAPGDTIDIMATCAGLSGQQVVYDHRTVRVLVLADAAVPDPGTPPVDTLAKTGTADAVPGILAGAALIGVGILLLVRRRVA